MNKYVLTLPEAYLAPIVLPVCLAKAEQLLRGRLEKMVYPCPADNTMVWSIRKDTDDRARMMLYPVVVLHVSKHLRCAIQEKLADGKPVFRLHCGYGHMPLFVVLDQNEYEYVTEELPMVNRWQVATRAPAKFETLAFGGAPEDKASLLTAMTGTKVRIEHGDEMSLAFNVNGTLHGQGKLPVIRPVVEDNGVGVEEVVAKVKDVEKDIQATSQDRWDVLVSKMQAGDRILTNAVHVEKLLGLAKIVDPDNTGSLTFRVEVVKPYEPDHHPMVGSSYP